jgi:hypothetical protein
MFVGLAAEKPHSVADRYEHRPDQNTGSDA